MARLIIIISGRHMISMKSATRILAASAMLCLVLSAPARAQAKKTKAGNPIVVLETRLGAIEVELFKEKAPKSVENFLAYVNSGFYNGTIFHRVKRGFMIQGGGFTVDMVKKPTRPPIPNEATNGLNNKRGTIAMARTPDPNSATAQFFINTVDNAALDHRGEKPEDFGYAVFGKVISGMEVAAKIEKVTTGSKAGHNDVPLQPVVITSAKLKN
jgi:cyclophilin family peptidyl-prolyl cis-trans isomerase